MFSVAIDKLNLAILHALENGPTTCAALAKQFQRGYSVIWRRLEKLREAGLVQRGTRRGKTGRALYCACIEKVRALFSLANDTRLTQELPG